MDAAQEKEHRLEVHDAYVAAARLRLVAVLSAAAGLVATVAVIGAILVGWLGVAEGAVALLGALLIALVPAARFYADGARTTMAAAALERQLGLDEDLYVSADVNSQRLRTIALIGLGIAAVVVAGILSYSAVNAGTREPDDDRGGVVDDDRGEDDERGGDGDDSRPEPPDDAGDSGDRDGGGGDDGGGDD